MASKPPVKVRLYAHPSRPNSYAHGGSTQINAAAPKSTPKGGFPAWVNTILDHLGLHGADRTAEGQALIARQSTAGQTTTKKTKGTVTPRVRGSATGGANTPAEWLKQAGWPTNLIPIMVAIGGAESGWRVDAVSPANTNGTKDYGWLQVNSVHGYDQSKLTTDPVYTARVAYQIYKSQGLAAWSTYNNGAYKSFLGTTPDPQPGRVRPGGEASGTGSSGSGGGSSDNGSDVDTELAAFWIPGIPLPIPNPVDLLKGASKAIHNGTDFLKWIAWIFHPLNVLRIVECLWGFSIMLIGFVAIIMAWRGASAEDVVTLLPQARAAKAAKALGTAKRPTQAATAKRAAAARQKPRKPPTGELAVA